MEARPAERAIRQRAIRGLGFEVILKTNAKRREMGRAVNDFAGRLDLGGRWGIVTGHGGVAG